MIPNFFVYGVGGAASRLAMIFLVPLYTRTLSVTEYGQLELLLALYSLAVLLAGLQSESAVLRDYSTATKNGWLPELIWASLVVTIFGAVGVAGLVALGSYLGWIDGALIEFLPLVVAVAILAQIAGIQLVVIRFAGRALVFAFLSFFDLVLSALASALLIIVLDWGIWGALTGLAVGKAITITFAWALTFAGVPKTLPGRSIYRAILSYSVPTMPSVLLNWLQTNGTRVLLAIFLLFADVALASVAIRVAALFGFVVYSFRLAWEPWAFAQLELQSRARRSFNDLLSGYVFAMFIPVCLAILAAPLLVAIFAPPEYSTATALVGSFVIGQYWIGIANITSIGIHGARVTSRLTWVFAAGALANLGLLALLAPRVGVLGSAVSFLIGAIISAMLAAWFSERHFRTHFSFRLLWVAAITSVLLATSSLLVYPMDMAADPNLEVWKASALLGLICIVLLGCLAFGGLTKQERGLMQRATCKSVRHALSDLRRKQA